MRITQVEIQNYKSISNLIVAPNPNINVFIGENSVGKSNIFDAMTWLIGPVYPSFNSTNDQDRFNGENTNTISIRLGYDNGETLELSEQWQDYRGNLKSGLNLSGNYVNNDTRQLYASAYLGIDRQILDYLPSNRWSLIGRILLEINEIFKNEETIDESTGEVIKKPELLKEKLENIRDDILFSVRDPDGNEIMHRFIRILQQESAKQLNKPENAFSVDLNLYDPWNFYRTLQLLVQENDTNLQFQASSLGMGIQASISIAVLKAYAAIRLRNNTPIFIDEPELFLHPQAQRNFYKILRELADNGTQIFITTHSPDFIDVGRFDEIFLVKKDPERGTYVRSAGVTKFIHDLHVRNGIRTDRENLLLHYKNAYENTGDTQKANEAFFAKKAILVEGESEALILPYFFQLINYDFIAKGVTIVRCGGKNELDRFLRLYSEFGIPCFVIFDGDNHNIGTDDEEATINANRQLLSYFDIEADFPDNQVHTRHLGFANRFDDNLGFTTSQKGLKLYVTTKRHITEMADVPGWVTELTTQLDAMPETVQSILQQ